VLCADAPTKKLSGAEPYWKRRREPSKTKILFILLNYT
jgi:hypothetical protein